jgi:hypothetical protein
MNPEVAARPTEVTATRESLLATLAALERRATVLAEAILHERPNRRFGDALTSHVLGSALRLRKELSAQTALYDSDRRALCEAVQSLGAVVEEIASLVEQRRDPVRLAELGDADTLADACYQPILTFARAEGLPITTSTPATHLGDFQLSIWTGFIPTSVAPIFLPPDFFRKVAWWPAIAHEIGHDFLASISELDAGLRAELGIVTAEVGARPLTFGPEGVSRLDLERVYGGWFEELFCDVFGTLMCGPAYVATMDQLFAAQSDPREVLIVWLDESGSRYDEHPPRHLRLVLGCQVLERAGFRADAKRLRQRWDERHATEGRVPDRLLFPAGEHFVAIPLDVFLPTLDRIVDKLYAGPLKALSGYGLRAISGLDYGPHAHAESERARAALVSGVVPRVRDPRAVIAGAVLATVERPDLEARILEHARAAIPAMGTAERRPDAYLAQASSRTIRREDVASAMVLREILGRRRSSPRGSRM